MTNIKDRVLQIAEYKGVAKEKFIENIGMTYGNFKGKSKESALNSNTIEKIITIHPDVNLQWLITGNGEMINSEVLPRIMNMNRKTTDIIHDSQVINLYDLEATAGLSDLFKSEQPQRVLDTIKIPNLPKCDGAITVTGDSMYPLLKSGDIVLYKKTDVENIFFGEMYLLSVRLDEWEEYITVKYIQRSDVGADFVKLVSQNTHHQPKDIPLAKITALALIKASIRINTMI